MGNEISLALLQVGAFYDLGALKKSMLVFQRQVGNLVRSTKSSFLALKCALNRMSQSLGSSVLLVHSPSC